MNKKKALTFRSVTQIAAILVLSMNVTSAAKLYKWVDAQGRISYQDQPPPQNSKILSEEELKTVTVKPKEFKLNTKSIDVYVGKDCPNCDATVQWLEVWGVPHQVKNIEDHRDIQTKLIQETSGVRVPALFNAEQLIKNTATLDGLKASLVSSGHIDPDAAESNKADSEPKAEIDTSK